MYLKALTWLGYARAQCVQHMQFHTRQLPQGKAEPRLALHLNRTLGSPSDDTISL